MAFKHCPACGKMVDEGLIGEPCAEHADIPKFRKAVDAPKSRKAIVDPTEATDGASHSRGFKGNP